MSNYSDLVDPKQDGAWFYGRYDLARLSEARASDAAWTSEAAAELALLLLRARCAGSAPSFDLPLA